MDIVIIYGSARKGSTWTLVQKVKGQLSALGEYQFMEYTLPRDLPEFCHGCMTCLGHGREKCPHAEYVAPIERDMLACGGIILASPVYAMDVSGPMKAFLDHLFSLWIPHQPEESMFHKAGLVISTAAGAGIGSTNKTMERTLKYWGVPTVTKLGVGGPTLEDGPTKMEKGATKAAARFHAALANRESAKPSPYIRIMFRLMGRMHRGAEEPGSLLARDFAHWKERGYLDGKKPWKGSASF